MSEATSTTAKPAEQTATVSASAISERFNLGGAKKDAPAKKKNWADNSDSESDSSSRKERKTDDRDENVSNAKKWKKDEYDKIVVTPEIRVFVRTSLREKIEKLSSIELKKSRASQHLYFLKSGVQAVVTELMRAENKSLQMPVFAKTLNFDLFDLATGKTALCEYAKYAIDTYNDSRMIWWHEPKRRKRSASRSRSSSRERSSSHRKSSHRSHKHDDRRKDYDARKDYGQRRK